MESIGAFPDGEWDSFSKMFSTEEPEFTAQFFGQCSFPLDQNEELNFIAPSNFCLAPEANVNIGEVNESLFYTLNSNLHYMSQESSYASNCSGSTFIPNSSHEAYFLGDSNHVHMTNDISMSMDICTMDEKKIGSFVSELSDDIVTKETALAANEDMSSDTTANAVKELQLKRKVDEQELHPTGNTMKKPRLPRDVQKNKKNVQSKKSQKPSPNGNDGEESNAGSDRQTSSSYSSEDDNGSHETNGGATSDSKTSTALNLSGKTRASRGSATDPQSLYARKRRERINERLRILQNLVPNGTKVDISTMLEEAVHYVKFLQLQIKLLSSDDLWMYAPLAYNGVDIELNQKISMFI